MRVAASWRLQGRYPPRPRREGEINCDDNLTNQVPTPEIISEHLEARPPIQFDNRLIRKKTQPANIKNSNLNRPNGAGLKQLFRRPIAGRYPSPRFIATGFVSIMGHYTIKCRNSCLFGFNSPMNAGIVLAGIEVANKITKHQFRLPRGKRSWSLLLNELWRRALAF